MSTFTRYFTALAVVLAAGLVSVGCVSKPKKAAKTPPAQPDKQVEDASATEADPGDIDIFAGAEDVSARASSDDILGTPEKEPEVKLDDEEVTAPAVEAPKTNDIEDM